MADRLGPALAAPLFERVAIIGIGLIGSSIARAARRRNVAKTIVIADCSREALARAAALGLADEVAGFVGRGGGGGGFRDLLRSRGRQ